MKDLTDILELARQNGCTVLQNEPMSKHTTFKIGGPAQLFVKADTVRALSILKKECGKREIPCMMCGNGSNLLVEDSGIQGVVIQLGNEFTTIRREENELVCGAAVSLARLASFAQNQGLSGLEFSYGIPGSVGGAVFMNAGAYGGEMKDVLLSCEHITESGEPGSFSGGELQMSYRKSAYTGRNCAVTFARFRLMPGDKKGIQEKMDDYMTRRRTKQPLEYPSAGSVFKRPEGHFAGALIEQCGLKGASLGGAQVSEKHAGFIINTGSATCGDVVGLIHRIQDKVLEETGVRLECEIKTVS